MSCSEAEKAWRWDSLGKKKGKKRWHPPESIAEQFGLLPDACQIRHLLLRLIFQDKEICLFQICTKSRCCQLAASSLGPGAGKSSACMHVWGSACVCACMPALSTRFCAQSVWVCQPRNCSPPGFLSMGISRQEYWSELSFPPQGNLLYQGIFCISCPGRRILCHWAPSQLRDVSWIYNPVGLWTQNLIFKPRCFGDYLRCKSLNLGVPAVFKPFIPGREALSLFPTVRVGFLMKLWPSLLHPLHCGPFLVCQMHRSSSVFRAFSRGSSSICKAVNLVCLWEVFLICK